jgi:hypothetical protein
VVIEVEWSTIVVVIRYNILSQAVNCNEDQVGIIRICEIVLSRIDALIVFSIPLIVDRLGNLPISIAIL